MNLRDGGGRGKDGAERGSGEDGEIERLRKEISEYVH
jgi:hypothetical protein